MTVRKNIIISKSTNERLKKECERLAVSQSNLVSFALDEYFRRVEKKDINKKTTSTVGE